MADDDVLIRFGSSIEGAEAGIKEVQESLEGLASPIAGLVDSFMSLGEAAAAAFAINEIREFASSMAELGLATERASAILGVPVEQIAGLRLYAESAGVSLDELQTSIVRMSRNIIEQTPAAGQSLEALGLSFKSLSGLNPTQQFATIAEALSHVRDASQQAAIAWNLFGRGVTRILPMIEQGAEPMAHWAQVADETGAALGPRLVAKMEATHKAMITLGAAVQGAGVATFDEFSGVINGAVQYLTNLAEEFTHSAASAGIVKIALDTLRRGFQALETIVVLVAHAMQEMWIAGFEAGDQIVIAFRTLGTVIADVFVGIAAGISGFFTGLIAAGRAATTAVGQQFSDLGAVIKGAFTGDAGAAWDKMKADAISAGDTIKTAMSGAVSGFDFSSVQTATSAGMAASKQSWSVYTGDIARIAREGQAELRTIFDTGTDEIKALVAKRDAALKPLPNADAKKAAEDALKATETEIDTEIALVEKGEEAKRKAYDDSLAHHRIGVAEWFNDTRASLDQELASVEKLYQQELAQANLTSNQIADIKKREAEAIEKINEELAASERKYLDDVQAEWQKMFSTINSAFDSQIKGLLTGTETWRQALKNVLTDLTVDVIKFFLNWALQQAENVIRDIALNQARVAAHISGNAEIMASDASTGAAGLAGIIGNIIQSIAKFAGQTAAGVSAFMAPIVGPAAPGIGAAAGATVATFGGLYDIGAWEIPEDQAAYLHKGELVATPSQADAIRSIPEMMSEGGPGGRVTIGGPSISFPSFDPSGMAAAFENHKALIVKSVMSGIRDSVHLAGRRGVRFA